MKTYKILTFGLLVSFALNAFGQSDVVNGGGNEVVVPPYQDGGAAFVMPPQQVPSTGDQPSHLDFYPVNDPGVPAAVRAAAASVYTIVAPAGNLTTVAGIFGEDHSIQEIINKVKSTPLSDQLSQGDKDVYLYQLEACSKQSNPLNCKMYEGDTLSTAYLVGDGSRIRTAFHAVSGVASKSQNSTTGSVSVPVFIYDSSGKLVYSPASGKTTAQFPKSNLSNISGGFTPPNNDLVEIQLSKAIGKPLVSATTAPKTGDAIYTIGYPQRSQDRSQYGAPDAPGGQLRVSTGHVISMNDSSKKQGVDPAVLTEQTKSIYRTMITTDADGAPGLSGGATVNASGQVVGTYTAGFPADGSATPNHVSYSSADSLLSGPFTH